jgi:hypothetical protein
MYDEVFSKAMVKSGVAEKLSEPLWVDEKQQATKEENAFGQNSTNLLLHPEYVVFVDEVGCNTRDGARGGEENHKQRNSNKRNSTQKL